jgi:hypothetical protein
MPFDPKLIQPDDAPLLPNGEIDLPADLAALGEQLRDDAAHLATRYPATVQASPLSVRRLRWSKISVLLTSVAATVLAGAVAMQLPLHRKATPKLAETPKLSESPQRGSPALAPAAIPAPVAGSPTAVSLTELSGPELEALMDLWQRSETEGRLRSEAEGGLRSEAEGGNADGSPLRSQGTGISF